MPHVIFNTYIFFRDLVWPVPTMLCYLTSKHWNKLNDNLFPQLNYLEIIADVRTDIESISDNKWSQRGESDLESKADRVCPVDEPVGIECSSFVARSFPKGSHGKRKSSNCRQDFANQSFHLYLVRTYTNFGIFV